MTNYRKIELLEELVKFYEGIQIRENYPDEETKLEKRRIKSELASLKDEGEKEPSEENKDKYSVYTLNCDNCEKAFTSTDAFPEKQLCNDCFAKKYIKPIEGENEIDLSSPDYQHTCKKCGNNFWNKTKEDTECESCKSSITLKDDDEPPKHPTSENNQSVSDEEDTEGILEPIQNALYATNRLSVDTCTDLSVGILEYIRDAGFKIIKSGQIPKK